MTPTALDVAGLPKAAAPPASGPEPAVPGLDWRPGAERPVPLGADGPVPLGRFASWLQEAGLLNARTIDLPGSAVLLPPAVDLFNRVEQVVRRRYVEAGYLEY